MFNWARPPVEMTTKFFLGEPCKVDRYTEEYPFEGDMAPLPLSGHTMGHTGYLCDGVLFAGDALYPKAIWERHKLPYSIDVELTRRSLDAIRRPRLTGSFRVTAQLCQRKKALNRSRFI